MEIIALVCFVFGAWLFNWYKSGEVKPKRMPAPVGSDSIKVSHIVEVFADGITADLETNGPDFLRLGIRIKMNGAKIPSGKNAPEKWLIEIIKKQFSDIVHGAKDIRIANINRGNDGVLNSDIIIDGVKLSAPTYNPSPEDVRMSRTTSTHPQAPPTIHSESKPDCPGYQQRPQQPVMPSNQYGQDRFGSNRRY